MPALWKRLDHRFELRNAAPWRGGIAGVRRKIPDRVVAPIIGEPLIQEMLVCHECVDGKQLDCRDAKVLQIFDHRPGGQTGIGASQILPGRPDAAW